MHQGSARSGNTHLSSNKPLLTTEEKYYRKLQDKVERTIACGCPARICTSTIQLLHLSPREGGGCGKIVRAGWGGTWKAPLDTVCPINRSAASPLIS